MIIWLEDPKQWKYLRVSQYGRGSRRGFKKGVNLNLSSFYKLIGYESEPTRIEPGSFLYTIYWLKTYDAGCPEGAEHYDKGGMPCEGVLVSRILEKSGFRRAPCLLY